MDVGAGIFRGLYFMQPSDSDLINEASHSDGRKPAGFDLETS